jgi:hypothetical protein
MSVRFLYRVARRVRWLPGALLTRVVGSACHGTTHACRYVDPSGSDANPGTSAAPFPTLQAAANVVNPGDEVVVRDGVYTGNPEVVEITRSRTATAWIVFAAVR